ncbi:SLC13 family permease [Algisphaera agarilytica]|uniref:Di/tricarboxylate transporter n=1 Tax=Algisphaera agarilytica TaxID=1385975 RepID=A0A7X0LIS1_9BACT|nr:SLC13 family permease [Algisphaera agarilytica]MBB6428520.1 di/tricarboxylate transporter [Algisphaera agarilytica]
MGWEAWLTLGVIALMAFAMLRAVAGPDTVLLGGMTLLVAMGLFSDAFPSAARAVSGFGNEAVVTIGVLFVIAEGLSRTGAMELLTRRLLGQPKSVRGAQVRMLPAVSGLSAFLNNTPIVAMFIPVVNDWCKKTGLSPSKLLIPLSYAAIMGGSCTLIGTATNVFVDGMVRSAQANGEALGPILETTGQRADMTLGMFTISLVGVPAALVGLGYLLLLSDKLLPERRTSVSAFQPDDDEAGRSFTVEMMVTADAPFAGQTVEKAGLRNLPGAYLVEIDRGGDRMVAVGPEQTLRVGDRLIFAGVVDSVVDLQKIRGLAPATDEVFKLDDPRPNRRLVEAVIAPQHPMIGKTIREGGFRTQYGAAVIAAYRGGAHLNKRLGDVRLRAGDTLLLDTHPRFVSQQRNRQDFILVSAVEGSEAARHDRAWIALGLLAAMVLLTTLTPMRLVTAALLAAGGMVLTGCCTPDQARQSVNWRVLLAMGGALGVGAALESTSAAVSVANLLVESFSGLGPVAILAAVYLAAMMLTSLIGPIGTVALMFPVAKAAAMSAGLNFEPFAIALMMTAAASFATPTAYQTNLMVYGVGGYRFSDFVRVGLPLNILVMIITLTIAPLVWPIQ